MSVSGPWVKLGMGVCECLGPGMKGFKRLVSVIICGHG